MLYDVYFNKNTRAYASGIFYAIVILLFYIVSITIRTNAYAHTRTHTKAEYINDEKCRLI